MRYFLRMFWSRARPLKKLPQEPVRGRLKGLASASPIAF